MIDSASSEATDGKKFAEKYTSKLLYASYAVMLALSIAILIGGLLIGNVMEVVIAIPVIFFLIDTLFVERTIIHIPPFIIYLMFVLMIMILFGRMSEGGGLLKILTDFLFGAVMGLGGLIVTYSLTRTMPGIREEKPMMTSLISISVAISVFTLIIMLQYYLSDFFRNFQEIAPLTIDNVMKQLVFVIIGAVFVSALFYFGKHSALMQSTVTKYLETRVGAMDVEEYESMEIAKALKGGESEKVEYKSTLRTNLSTGEKDPRMEKAVLKTIVAFLNSNGGTLLIGVADDGTVIGVDEESFDNRDKLNLHLTNIIASQIGNEYLPYISFRLSDYEGKGVVRVVCRKSDSPVFLKDGKQETFYVRSGPSSVDLHGMDTLNYVLNRFKMKRKDRLR